MCKCAAERWAFPAHDGSLMSISAIMYLFLRVSVIVNLFIKLLATGLAFYVAILHNEVEYEVSLWTVPRVMYFVLDI